MNKDDKNRHFVLLIIDISKHRAKEMGHVKKEGPGFVNDFTAWWPGFVPKQFTNKQEPKQQKSTATIVYTGPQLKIFQFAQTWPTDLGMGR